MDNDGVLCLVGPDGAAEWLRPRPGVFDGVRSLDGAWLEHALADVAHSVSYQHGVDLVVDAVTSSAAVAAVLIRPVSIAEIERTAPEAAYRTGGAQPRVNRRNTTDRQATSPNNRSAASRSAAATPLCRRTGMTASATTSVRLWVAPPTRKKRRRTVPTTTNSAPTTRMPSCAGVGSCHGNRDRRLASVGLDPGGHVELHDHPSGGEVAGLGFAGHRASDDGEIAQRRGLVAVVHGCSFGW
jgi:hypothetical protein